MRLLTITKKYNHYLEQVYRREPSLKDQSYRIQQEALESDSFGGSEIWAAGLKNFGYCTNRIFANAEFTQKRWAFENSVLYDETNWIQQITAAQVKTFQPEILITTLGAVGECFLKSIREENKDLRLIICWCGSPFNNHDRTLREYDVILSNIPEYVHDFKENGLHASHLRHAFDPRVLRKIDNTRNQSINFSFVGSLIKGREFHNSREALLLELMRKTDLQIWSAIRRPSYQKRLSVRTRRIVYSLVQIARRLGAVSIIEYVPYLHKAANWPSRPELNGYADLYIARRSHPPVFGMEMFQKLRDSKVTLNTHIDVSQRSASNMRLYEATGVGTCLLTDWKDNIKELFEPGFEVVTYRNSRDCVEKARFLLRNEKVRQEIADAGQRRTFQEHTIYHRAGELNEIILEYLHKF